MIGTRLAYGKLSQSDSFPGIFQTQAKDGKPGGRKDYAHGYFLIFHSIQATLTSSVFLEHACQISRLRITFAPAIISV